MFNTFNFRSEIIHAERKREQQTFETIEEEEDDDDGNDVARAPPRRPSYSHSYGSEISLVTEERENHGRKNKKKTGQQKSQSSSLDLERSLSARALKVRHVFTLPSFAASIALNDFQMAADVKNRLGLGRGSVEPESGSTIGVDDILDSNRSEPRNPADSEYYVVLSEFLNVVPNFKKDL